MTTVRAVFINARRTRDVAAGEGDVFGEMALIDKSKRAATATATAPTSLAMIDQREFLFLVHETPTFAIQVMSSLADRLRKLDSTL